MKYFYLKATRIVKNMVKQGIFFILIMAVLVLYASFFLVSSMFYYCIIFFLACDILGDKIEDPSDGKVR